MLSTKLRENTKTGHHQLEKIVVQKLKAIRSDQDYADLLKYFYAYFNRIEQVIAPFITSQLLPDHAERRNSVYLKQDIEALGYQVNNLPSTTIPEIKNTLQALGAMYVLEGSIMGGSIIVQILGKTGITKGISFFSGYGPSTGEMWSKFVKVLNVEAETEADQETAVAAANETFVHFAKIFGTVEVA